MKFGIVVFPGSNCDRDMQDALQQDLQKEVIMLWHKDDHLSGLDKKDCVVLPGGFSYGDYLRCGAIARFSPMMKAVIAHAEAGGKVLGVCNGFQILCEAGLLPGALLQNDHQQFRCSNVYLTNGGKALKIPVAHGDGRYYADQVTLEELHRKEQVLFHYCNENGEVLTESSPNGSCYNIAGIRNRIGNVMGMMPHPERATNTLLGNTDGMEVFRILGLA